MHTGVSKPAIAHNGLSRQGDHGQGCKGKSHVVAFSLSFNWGRSVVLERLKRLMIWRKGFAFREFGEKLERKGGANRAPAAANENIYVMAMTFQPPHSPPHAPDPSQWCGAVAPSLVTIASTQFTESESGALTCLFSSISFTCRHRIQSSSP